MGQIRRDISIRGRDENDQPGEGPYQVQRNERKLLFQVP